MEYIFSFQVDKFQSYCRPTKKPILSEFCTELTGIQQVCIRLHDKLTFSTGVESNYDTESTCSYTPVFEFVMLLFLECKSY